MDLGSSALNYSAPPQDDLSNETEDRGEALIRQRIRERKREKMQKQRDTMDADMSRSLLSDIGDARGAELPSSRECHKSENDAHAHFEAAPDVSCASTDAPTEMGDNHTHQAHLDICSTDTQGSIVEHDHECEDEVEDDDENLDYTVKDRQDALNIEHPFGLPIWKPALYKKSRSIQRTADKALKCTPGMRTSRSAMLGNVVWVAFFGLWIGALCFMCSGLLYLVPRGGNMYAHTMYGLGVYILWPFGNYVEVECSHESGHRHGPCRLPAVHEHEVCDEDESEVGVDPPQESDETQPLNETGPSHNADTYGSMETNDDDPSLLTEEERISRERKLYHYVFDDDGNDIGVRKRIGGIVAYGLVYGLVLFPVLGFVCLVCWGLVFTIPMAKLTWVLIKNLASQPLALHFRSPLQIDTRVLKVQDPGFAPVENVLHPGHMAPLLKRKHRKKGTSKRRSVILLCLYQAMGKEYVKYTVGGVNIMFVNTIPIIFLTQIMFFVIRPLVLSHNIRTGVWALLSNDALIFMMSLASVLPLSYFIGMAVASISTQSSIGMGAVINATFGSIIELILYSIALTEDKASLVEGSIIGSILAGVLLMPGLSMCSGATRRKELSFNSRSAGVTSTMLIMAIIGILTPTLFYQIYGKFELVCTGCPDDVTERDHFRCEKCNYEHISPLDDSFFQTHVRGLIYTCTAILLLGYAIGLWFSLRTHASHIWNSTPNSGHVEHITPPPPPLHRASVYKRLFPKDYEPRLPLHHDEAEATSRTLPAPEGDRESVRPQSVSGSDASKFSKNKPSHDELLVDAAARMYQYLFNQHKSANVAIVSDEDADEEEEGQGGHDAPSWSRTTSLSVLLGCTVMYAIIAEIIVDLVDVVVKGSGLSPKFIGVTLFALVPNTTEFMNAMSFAINGNIALSLEIGSAYVLQVCLIQIPVLVIFSSFYNYMYAHPGLDMTLRSFTLIFPRWDVISIILSIFLLTYTYNEARSNYHRGSILILVYLVLIAGFFFAPSVDLEDPAQNPVRHVFPL